MSFWILFVLPITLIFGINLFKSKNNTQKLIGGILAFISFSLFLGTTFWMAIS